MGKPKETAESKLYSKIELLAACGVSIAGIAHSIGETPDSLRYYLKRGKMEYLVEHLGIAYRADRIGKKYAKPQADKLGVPFEDIEKQQQKSHHYHYYKSFKEGRVKLESDAKQNITAKGKPSELTKLLDEVRVNDEGV